MRETAPRLLTFALKSFGRRQLDLVRVAAVMSGKEPAMRCARAWGAGSDLGAKKRLEASGRDDRVFVSLSPDPNPMRFLFFFSFYVSYFNFISS